MKKISKEAKNREEFLKRPLQLLRESQIDGKKMENFCPLIMSHTKKEKSSIIHKIVDKEDFIELLEYISVNSKEEAQMKLRDIERSSYKAKNIVFNATAVENPNLMKLLAQNFENFKIGSKLNDLNQLKDQWNQKVDNIQQIIQQNILNGLSEYNFLWFDNDRDNDQFDEDCWSFDNDGF